MLESLSKVEITNKRDKRLVWLLVATVIVGRLAIGHTDTTLAPSYVSRMIPILNYALMGSMFLCINRRQRLGWHTVVKMIVVESPKYRITGGESLSADLMKSLCEEYGVRFIDNSQIPFFLEHPELFNDITHLNDDGAKVYTEMFLEEIGGSY